MLTWFLYVCSLQVDLFFYRDPEEAKDQEEEAAGAPEYAAVEYAAPGQWGADQWTSDVAAPPPVAGGDWPVAEGLSFCSPS